MSRSKAKHKAERKRRHERQIAEGARTKPKRKKNPVSDWNNKTVRLSEIDADVVQKVLAEVQNIDFAD